MRALPKEWELTEAPATLIARLVQIGEAKDRPTNAGEPAEGVTLDTPQQIQRARVVAARLLQAGPKERYRKACRIKDEGVSALVCHAIMTEAGFDEDGQTSLAEKIASAYRNGRNPLGSKVADGRRTIAEMQAQMAAAAQKAEPSAGFKVLTCGDLMRRRPLTAILKRVLYRRTLTMLIGPYSRFKSFIALDMACHVALGLDWAGHKARGAQDVLYIAAEGEDGLRNRLTAWQQVHGAEPARLRFITGGIHLVNDADKIGATLDALAAQDFRPVVIFIDTLASATAGVNENTYEIGVPIEACRQIARARDAAVVLVDHTGKDEKKGARGWSGKGAAADASFLIDGDRDALTATMTVDKPLKDGRCPEPLGFKGREIVLGEDEDGDVITSLVFSHAPGVQVGRREGRSDPITTDLYKRAFLEVIHDVPAKTSVVAETMARVVPLSDQDDTAGARLNLQGKIKAWLDNIARGRTTVLEVSRCKALMPDGKTTGWRKVANSQGEAS